VLGAIELRHRLIQRDRAAGRGRCLRRGAVREGDEDAKRGAVGSLLAPADEAALAESQLA
jgi:hypothetical protein